jgi:hypothetical protein
VTGRVGDNETELIAHHVRGVHRKVNVPPALTVGEAFNHVTVVIVSESASPQTSKATSDATHTTPVPSAVGSRSLTTEERSVLECFPLLGIMVDGKPVPCPLDRVLERGEELVGVPDGRIASALLALQEKGCIAVVAKASLAGDHCLLLVTETGLKALGF